MAGRLFGVFSLALVAQGLYYYPQLPERVASHFGASGAADGWSSKTSFFLVEALVVALMVVLFWGLPLAMARIPDGLINLPNKAYWLAPERREATFEAIRDGLLWCGVATLALIFVIFHWAIQANLEPPPRLPGSGMWLLLAGYLGFMTVWAVRFHRSFELPPDVSAS